MADSMKSGMSFISKSLNLTVDSATEVKRKKQKKKRKSEAGTLDFDNSKEDVGAALIKKHNRKARNSGGSSGRVRQMMLATWCISN